MEGATTPDSKTPAPISSTRARERRKSLLLKKLGLNGKNYDLEVLETLKRKNRGKEVDGGWDEIEIDGKHFIEIYNPLDVGITLDIDEYLRLNMMESSLPTIPEEDFGDECDCDEDCRCCTK